MTREQWWVWGEIMALCVALLAIAGGMWVAHDDRWVWGGMALTAITFVAWQMHDSREDRR